MRQRLDRLRRLVAHLWRLPTRRTRNTVSGFSDAVKSEVAHRSQGNCEANLPDCSGRASHVHHRQLRRWGDHSEANALHVCFRCHDRIHRMGDEAYNRGLLVHGWDDPASIPLTQPHR